MSLLVTFVLLNGPDNASLECLAKSLEDLMSKTAFSRAPGESGTYCTCMERFHLRHPQILQEESEFWIPTFVSVHLQMHCINFSHCIQAGCSYYHKIMSCQLTLDFLIITSLRILMHARLLDTRLSFPFLLPLLRAWT